MLLNRQDPDLPEYRVRESARAKYLRLQVTPHEGLVVVVPKGVDHALIAPLVHEKRAWIERALARVATAKRLHEETGEPPEQIELRAIDQTYTVSYQPSSGSRTRARPHGPGRLVVHGDLHAEVAILHALRRWLIREAHHHLVPWLHALAKDTGLSFEKVAIRGQKTRWGSCSARGIISINYKLLFLPRALVRYVFLHELAHTVHMDHSPDFWTLLSELEPECLRLHRELRASGERVPAWVDRGAARRTALRW